MANTSRETNAKLMPSKVLKPSPNEEEAILKGVIAERRKQRLLQVRKQQKKLSGKILNAVKSKREKEVNFVKQQFQNEWEKKVSAELEILEQEYKNRMETLGEGHRSVAQVLVKDSSKSATFDERAMERHNEALRKLAEQRLAMKVAEEEKMRLRQKVAKEEQTRASIVAAKPPPVPDFILNSEKTARGSTLGSRTKTTESFSTTRFHMPIAFVEKAEQKSKQEDAREAAKNLEEKVLMEREILEKDFNERKEKANLRHQHARKQVLLDQSKDRLIEQLEDLEFKDRMRRQQALAKIPKQVFQPPYQRVEDARSRQIMLEEAFENAHIPKRAIHHEELNLDLDSELDLTMKDFARQDGISLDDEIKKPNELLQVSDDSHIPASDVNTGAEFKVDTKLPSQPKDAASNKVQADSSSRMQKLLGRIRKQQDEWTKQKAKRKDVEADHGENEVEKKNEDKKENGGVQPAPDNETTDSLISADIESARYTNSNTNSTDSEREKRKTEEASSEDIQNHSPPSTSEENSLLHPFEKAKLIRSASNKADNGMGVEHSIDQESNADVKKHKQKLVNQKYLYKIQRQRLENELLRQDLQAAEKELDGLIRDEKENRGSNAESLVASNGFVSSDTKLNREERLAEAQSDSVLRTESDVSHNVVAQTDFSFMSGLSATQRRKLALKYPNIFKGFAVDEYIGNEVTAEGQINNTANIDRESIVEYSLGAPVQMPESSVSATVVSSVADRISRLSKPKFEIERIRKYQEQLLEKQKWLKSRQDVIQRRHFNKINQFSKSSEAINTEEEPSNIEFSTILAKDVKSESATTSSVPFVINGSFKSGKEAVVHGNDEASDSDDKKGALKAVANISSYNRRFEGTDNNGSQTGLLASNQDLAKLLGRSSTLNQRQMIYEDRQTSQEVSAQNENRGRLTNDIRDFISQMHQSEIPTTEQLTPENFPGAKTSFTHIQPVAKERQYQDSLQGLLNDIDLLHSAVESNIDRSSAEDSSVVDGRKSHRIVSGKPAFSPIQEVEETSFKEKNVRHKVMKGTGSLSSLAEQELPASGRLSSEPSSTSLRGSSASVDKSNLSSMLSLRELVSNLSETEFLPLPKKPAPVPSKEKLVLEEQGGVNDHRRAQNDSPRAPPTFMRTADWTQLLPDYSEMHTRDHLHNGRTTKDAGNNSKANDTLKDKTEIPRTNLTGDIFEFDREKYHRLIQENIPFDILSPESRKDDGKYSGYPNPSEIFSPVKLRNKEKEMGDLGKDERVTPSQNLPASSSTASMRETNPVLLSSEGSSTDLSKGSATNMSKYEEILERVRMLPYRHLEEYNRLAESYQTWRKKTVEPLLHPDVPDPFTGYEVFLRKEPVESKFEDRDVDTSKGQGQLGFEFTHHFSDQYVSANRAIEMANGPKMAEDHTADIRMQSASKVFPQASFPEAYLTKMETSPLNSNHNGLYSEFSNRSERKYELIGPVTNVERASTNATRNSLDDDRDNVKTQSLNGSKAIDSVEFNWDGSDKRTRSNSKQISQILGYFDGHRYEEDLNEMPVALLADQLMEQKLSRSMKSDIFEEADSPENQKNEDQQQVLEIMGTGRKHFEHQTNMLSLRYDSMKPIDSLHDAGEPNVIQNTSPDHSDVEDVQQRYLDKYISGLEKSAATKSSLTNSSSHKTKSQFSSEFRSDETVSELARLWPLSSQSIGAGIEESRVSTTISNAGANTPYTSVPNYSGISIDKKSKPGNEISSGFKDPNEYEISLYRLPKHKNWKITSLTDTSKSTSAKDESDNSFSLPSFPRFASTRQEISERPSSASISESSFGSDVDEKSSGTMRSILGYDDDLGHAETSWLFTAGSLKDGSVDENIIQLAGEGISDIARNSVLKVQTSDSSLGQQYPSSETDRSPELESTSDPSESNVIGTWTDLLARQMADTSVKKSHSDLPDSIRLKKDVLMKRSQERSQKVKEEAAKREVKAVKFRADGKIGRSSKVDDKENKNPTQKIARKSQENSSDQSRESNLRSTKRRGTNKKPTKQEILHENRRRVKQFQQKIQSSLRNRRK